MEENINNQQQVTEESVKYIISTSPHLYKRETTKNIMWLVNLALLPAAVFGIFAFGIYTLFIIMSSIAASLVTEAIILKIRKKDISLDDGSAVLTGLLLALNMPPGVPLYIPIISSIFAIGIVKQAFGGLGENWANPAIAGRVFALFAWSKKMTVWALPFTADAVSSATPLGAYKSALLQGSVTDGITKASGFIAGMFSGPLQVYQTSVGNSDISYIDLFFGFKGGCIGEISVFLLLIGASFLIYRKIITLDIPLSYLLTALLIAWIFGGVQLGNGYFQGDFLFHFLTGGLVLGAFFMATDMVTTPITIKGRIVFGIGCGVITMLIRFLSGLPEGVSLSILFMNMMTPTLDRIFKIKPMGYIKENKNK
ncbi:MAG: RnfABCDGE type electron transport complex subunit D [Spirochaetes bacterium]|nr:RnfABCDGE type electron transport complex subunit D [Spirochaetota bacterium]